MSPAEFPGGGGRRVPQAEMPIAAQRKKMMTVRSKMNAFHTPFVSARRGRSGRSAGYGVKNLTMIEE